MRKIRISGETKAEINELIEFLSSRFKVKQRGNPSKSKDSKYWNVYLDVKQIQKTT
ncbi:DUF3970 family protein [Clostridium beijerinckii]|uniref:DUF3970 family protein n=1 Tax=Clostridium beijerinckii TaxID=1520 RepID=A0AAW3W9V3_CLOBE|nr:DUF3970 family protein [Clostridium beijerinckii]MBC2458148.1 DUF3970 family protein [Clostridium beijerinckii]MBC2475367.1 DUF3970 family protein [Clostridium beijerinckii]NOV62585.1 hypothetical protein [Clostridium beijerinckii]NOV70454.1 hypothetical protein [Clostridium beijerinckii]NOW30637.1 hypothetical protein [Clostridium beijerinckii]